jgi:hypothetical protein
MYNSLVTQEFECIKIILKHKKIKNEEDGTSSQQLLYFSIFIYIEYSIINSKFLNI